ncbi:glycoside hydrolase family 25 protein [Athelia psychrophila]|uniref:Glycoside hydrolase family 25 protein n=1 Tax=Athelia psychrophila TaxID=1759441 RepID=A0A166KTQ1_9AGAM|nr:glycoside hydrolase family 25 protein [Fibularhizoctonia sp. CBS 109695]
MLSSSFFAFVLAASIASTSATVLGVDSSQLVSEGTYSTAKGEGFTKAIIRGFEEACGSGGQVDPNFVGTYNNARAAGYTNIDAYWFPCSGSGNSCKSYATQIADLGATFSANSMDIGRSAMHLNQAHFLQIVRRMLRPREVYESLRPGL